MNKRPRDVIIKLVPTTDIEITVFQYFKEGSFPHNEIMTLIPALDILRFDDRWSFVVLPRCVEIPRTLLNIFASNYSNL